MAGELVDEVSFLCAGGRGAPERHLTAVAGDGAGGDAFAFECPPVGPDPKKTGLSLK